MWPAANQLIFASVVPVGFATTFPVEALLGRSGWDVVFGGVVLSVVGLVLLRA